MTDIAAIYTRLSNDPSGDRNAVERQEEDCRARAAKEGLEVFKVYEDNDISASTKSKKDRPQYREMFADARAGKFQYVISYSNSRLTRSNREFEDLVDLFDETGVVFLTIVSGDDDLATASGRQIARIKASIASGEAELTSERSIRAARQRAERGIPKKGRWKTFGYDDEFNIIESEAAVIRDAFSRVIVGESLQSIAALWRDTGVDLGQDNEVHFSTISNILKRPLYAGLATYKGEVVGKSTAKPIVALETFQAAQEALSGRGRKRGGKNARRYVLAGLVACGLCGHPMMGAPGAKNKQGKSIHAYTCKKVLGGCQRMGVQGPRVEAIALAVVRQSLIVKGKQAPAPDLIDYQSQIDEVEADRATIQKAIDDRSVKVVDVMDILKDLSTKQRGIERKAAAQTAAQEAENSFEDWEAFTKGTLSEQMAMVNHVIKALVIERATSTQWNPDRVTVHLANGTEVLGSGVDTLGINPLVIIDGFRQSQDD